MKDALWRSQKAWARNFVSQAATRCLEIEHHVSANFMSFAILHEKQDVCDLLQRAKRRCSYIKRP